MANHYDIIREVKYLPLRLSARERQMYNLLTAALYVSEYTDKVDQPKYQRSDLFVRELKELYHIIWGLHIASGGKDIKLPASVAAATAVGSDEDEDVSMTPKGENGTQPQNEDSDDEVGGVEGVCLRDNADFFASLFEIGRRYKIMNPDKMRSDYGKLMYLMQDACSKAASTAFGFKPYKPIVTVFSALDSNDLLKILEDPRLVQATTPVDSTSPNELKQNTAIKEQLIRELCDQYAGDSKNPAYEVLERCIRSIDDAQCFLRDNVATLEKMIGHLRRLFPGEVGSSNKRSLEISYGRGGSCLSHSHSTQHVFVLQSLTVWKCVMRHMFRLWHIVELDMLETSYSYRYTGQGYQRVQGAPRIGSEMRTVLSEAARESGHPWVGLSVVHLGDNDVPNALVFIDKYTQVPRIVNPILKCIEGIPAIASEWEGIQKYLTQTFGSTEDLIVMILRDFFRHGFDGSGDDGGSCIDGRLTSAWNWCQNIGKKTYFPVFLLTGFSSFDGSF